MSSMPWGAVTKDWKRRSKAACFKPQQGFPLGEAQGWTSVWSMAGYGCDESAQPHAPSVLFAPGSCAGRHTSGRNSLEFAPRYPTCTQCNKLNPKTLSLVPRHEDKPGLHAADWPASSRAGTYNHHFIGSHQIIENPVNVIVLKQTYAEL